MKTSRDDGDPGAITGSPAAPATRTANAGISSHHPRDWWHRPGLEPLGGRLAVAGRDAEALAREHGVPLFVYDLTYMEESVRALQEAMARTGLPWKVRWALKAQREPEVLARLLSLGAPDTPGFTGLDVCSPGEVEHGIAHGFPASEISYTGTNVSDRDLDVILEHGVHMNLDLLSQIRRYGRRNRGGTIGLRINPRVSAARPESGISYYSGDRPTQFGIYPERLDEAIALARSYDLTVDTVHFHVSHQMLDNGLPAFDRAVAAAASMARRAIDAGCPLREINAGGGLAPVMRQEQKALDLDAYAGILAEHFGPLGVTMACEPGELFTRNAAVLLAEVVTIEDRSKAGDGSAVFAGLTYGWNIMHTAFIYHEFVETVLCRAADAPRGNVHPREPYQRGTRSDRRGLPDAAAGRGRHRRYPRRRLLLPGQLARALPAAVPRSDLVPRSAPRLRNDHEYTGAEREELTRERRHALHERSLSR